jgi:hypothetical protein
MISPTSSRLIPLPTASNANNFTSIATGADFLRDFVWLGRVETAASIGPVLFRLKNRIVPLLHVTCPVSFRGTCLTISQAKR